MVDLWKETWHTVPVELLIRICIDSSPVYAAFCRRFG